MNDLLNDITVNSEVLVYTKLVSSSRNHIVVVEVGRCGQVAMRENTDARAAILLIARRSEAAEDRAARCAAQDL